MAIDEEQPSFAIEISDEVGRTIQEQLVSSGVAGALSLIPGVGSALNEMMTKLAIRRTNERIKELFEHFTTKIQDIGETRIDREWFRSEEFQTLLYEALQQLHVTHDREKIEMLGVALANSGAPGFKEEERKDLFIRFVRDLTRQHLRVLVELAPPPEQPRPDAVVPLDGETARKLRWESRPRVQRGSNDDLLAIQMLHAYGLVEESITSSIARTSIPSQFTSTSQIRNIVKKFSNNMQSPTVTRTFRLSPLGDEFLRFTGLPRNTPAASEAKPASA